VSVSLLQTPVADPPATAIEPDTRSLDTAAPARPAAGPRREAPSDNWPHTTRILPWLVAAFIAMLWLVPFNTISMTVSLPFDLHFDRIVLPVIGLVWVLALAAGGRGAPRVRLTLIHGAVGAWLVVAMLSVVVNAGSLNRALVYNQSLKALVLLASYVSVFVLIASVVRRDEVPAFMKYTLGLAVVCALGALWEFRFHYNVFYQLANTVLKGPFKVQLAASTGVDEIGRRLTLGPAELALELAGMLTMALPIALVGVMQSERRRNRVLCGLAACILLAGGVATYRKTAVVAPLVVLASLACFRPRQVLRLVPYGIVLIAAVHVLSPGALGGVIEQLSGSRLSSVNTVLHRADAYEAVRPLVWSHPLLGLGYGGYDAFANRILDNQMLGSLIEVGVIGVATYVFVIFSSVIAAIPLIRKREPRVSPYALAVAAAAVGYFTLSFLYDVMAFPHVPYIFLTLAAFLAVLLRPPEEGRRAVPLRRRLRSL
jgi:hypothetical protein